MILLCSVNGISLCCNEITNCFHLINSTNKSILFKWSSVLGHIVSSSITTMASIDLCRSSYFSIYSSFSSCATSTNAFCVSVASLKGSCIPTFSNKLIWKTTIEPKTHEIFVLNLRKLQMHNSPKDNSATPTWGIGLYIYRFMLF